MDGPPDRADRVVGRLRRRLRVADSACRALAARARSRARPEGDVIRGSSMSRLRVLISTSSFGAADTAPLTRLEDEGIDVCLNPHGRVLTEDEVAALASDVDGLIAGTEPL